MGERRNIKGCTLGVAVKARPSPWCQQQPLRRKTAPLCIAQSIFLVLLCVMEDWEKRMGRWRLNFRFLSWPCCTEAVKELGLGVP